MSENPLNDAVERARPESFRAKSLAASLTVNDLPKSLAWYRDVLGLTVDEEYERGGKLQAVSLKAGAVRILLGQDDGAKGWERAKGTAFSMMLTTSQDVDAIAARIKENGGTLESEPADTPWGVRAFRVKDLDGFLYTISTERPDR